MNLISIQDRPFFDKMYPNTRGGEFLARIAYQHRHLDEKFDPKVDKMLSKGVFADDKKFKEYVLSFTNRLSFLETSILSITLLLPNLIFVILPDAGDAHIT